MSRYLRAFARVLLRPAIVGAVYMIALTVWVSTAPVVAENDRALGAQARAVSDFVVTRFSSEIVRFGVAIAACAIVIGAMLGIVAEALIRFRRRMCGARPPVGARMAVRALAVIAVMHAFAFAYGMARTPQLYADAFYARGGVRRTVQLLITEVIGTRGIVLVAVVLLLAYLFPLRSWHKVGGTIRRIASALAIPTAIALLLAALWPRIETARANPPATRMNVLVIAADSLRADRLTPAVAPEISKLAARGTRFDRAYVSIPRTFPSWVTILTGRHAHHHGIRHMFPRWDERAKTFDALPSRLGKVGYSTAVVSDYAGDIFSRIDLGFRTVDTPTFNFRQLLRQRAIERQTPLLPFLTTRAGRAIFPVLRELNDAADPDLLARDAVSAMADLPEPFFLTVFFSTAHFPYAAPSPYYRKFTDPTYRGAFKYHKPVGLGADDDPNAADITQVRALYDGAVASIDDAAKRILGELEARGLADHTIVIVTADHGETLFDNGHGQGHGDHLFGDEGTHVPLVIFDPRHAGGHRDSNIVRDVDLAPTLYDLTGVSSPSDLDGRSLAAALDGKGLEPAYAVAETELWMGDVPALPDALRLPYPGVARLTEIDPSHGDEIVLRREMEPITRVARHRMVRDERYKLIYAPTRTGARYLLFDTIADPAERFDVAASHAADVDRLRAELWRWMLLDVEMTERSGYLVPKDTSALARLMEPPGALRIDE